MRRGIPNLFKSGTQHMKGKEEAVVKNIDACSDLAQITRTSMGPNGMENFAWPPHLSFFAEAADCLFSYIRLPISGLAFLLSRYE